MRDACKLALSRGTWRHGSHDASTRGSGQPATCQTIRHARARPSLPWKYERRAPGLCLGPSDPPLQHESTVSEAPASSSAIRTQTAADASGDLVLVRSFGYPHAGSRGIGLFGANAISALFVTRSMERGSRKLSGRGTVRQLRVASVFEGLPAVVTGLVCGAECGSSEV